MRVRQGVMYWNRQRGGTVPGHGRGEHLKLTTAGRRREGVVEGGLGVIEGRAYHTYVGKRKLAEVEQEDKKGV